jgi:uncharacterized membrane protein
MGTWILLLQGAHSEATTAAEINAEAFIVNAIYWLELTTEAFAALVIGIGVMVALFHSMKALFLHQPVPFARNRLRLSRFLVFALELELASDILGTGISPTWDEIGKLGAIAAIRTALNYFLAREMKEQQKIVAEGENEGLPAQA